MGIVAGYAVPHPPLIVPAVGRGQEMAISDTIASFQEVARRTAAHRPDVIVITSPHAPAFRDGFFISNTTTEEGSMASFGRPDESLAVSVDTELARDIAQRLKHHGIPVAQAGYSAESLDHATYVPLYFLKQAMNLEKVPIVRIGLSGLPEEDHRLLGRLIADAVNELDRRAVFIASGDWSHKLKSDGPYGFVPEGPKFDRILAEIFAAGTLNDLFHIDQALSQNAAECGLRSFQIMAGALENDAFTSELLSYEGPFGVGYGVAAFEVDSVADSTQEEAASEEEDHGIDPLVALARMTVDSYVSSGKAPSVPKDYPEEYLHRRAGVFVSLHEKGDLRGCIGTISPQKHSIAEEVIANAISACSQDPRFPPVQPEELDYLSFSVDVLGEPEKVDSLLELDPKRYGVIVTRAWKRGLLLPDLEGVETVNDQIAIAKRKAGIGLTENATLERFEVIRHSAGGKARCE